MGFFDQLGDVAKNIGKSAGDFAKQVGDKTNDALEISKLNTKISAENAEIEKEKKKLSDALFERFARGEEVPEEVKEFCDNIKSHLLNIDGFKEEIEKELTKPRNTGAFYRALMAIVDFISGMTDTYALSLYQELTGQIIS